MAKDKLRKFAEMDTFSNVVQPSFEQSVGKEEFSLQSRWAQQMFNNQNPIVLELGCGKGEYTVGLSRLYPQKNFIGIDIKGARMWKGAKEALDCKLNNVCFLRTRIEFIDHLFSNGEVSEIWITFPDPQLKERREKKRLTHPGFLEKYKKFLAPKGIVHLKTDSSELHLYTKSVLAKENAEILVTTEDLYAEENDTTKEAMAFQTFYESGYVSKGKKITYLKFRLS